MKLSPDEIAALADQAVTKYIERKQKRYDAMRQKRSRLKRDQMKQSELSRLVQKPVAIES